MSTRSSGDAGVGPKHYQAFCGFCLGIMFLAQLQQGLFLANILVILVGTLGLLSQLRIAPILLLMFFAGVQMHYQAQITFLQGRSPLQDPELTIPHLALAAAMLGYVAGHYRLQAAWRQLWPLDPRLDSRRSQVANRRRGWTRQQPFLEPRPEQHITAAELIRFVVSVPIWLAVGMLFWLIVNRHWQLLDLPANLARIAILIMSVAAVAYVVRLSLGYWHHRERDAVCQRLYLQDVLWNETRGEQRRLNRWLAWWRNEQRAEQPEST